MQLQLQLAVIRDPPGTFYARVFVLLLCFNCDKKARAHGCAKSRRYSFNCNWTVFLPRSGEQIVPGMIKEPNILITMQKHPAKYETNCAVDGTKRGLVCLVASSETDDAETVIGNLNLSCGGEKGGGTARRYRSESSLLRYHE